MVWLLEDADTGIVDEDVEPPKVFLDLLLGSLDTSTR